MNNSRVYVKVLDLKKQKVLQAFVVLITGILAAIMLASKYHKI